MSDLDQARIAISLGDYNGIGIEVVLKALHEISSEYKPILIGAPAALDYYSTALSLSLPASCDLVEIGGAIDVKPGTIDMNAGKVAMQSVERGIELCMNGEADALVTAPISKEAIHLAGFDFPGHTEYLAHKTKTARVLMVMISGDLRVCVFTKHIPLSAVAGSIEKATLKNDLKLLGESLSQDFGIETPRIAVLGLNPHAGEGGDLGREEIEIIAPVIQDLRQSEFDLAGPFPADGFFGTKSQDKFDGIMAMYHDQGLVPFKALTFNSGVNFTAGLPIVRTSPDHGTAFGIAGQGVAEAGSMLAAISLALEVAKKRAAKPEIIS